MRREARCRILKCRLGIEALSDLIGPVLETGSGWQEPDVATGSVVGNAGQTLVEASSPDVEENEQGLLDKLWLCDHEYLLKGDNNLCQWGSAGRGRRPGRGNWQGIWGEVCTQVLAAVGIVWTSFPERPSPNMVMRRVPSLQLGSSEFSGRHVCIQRIVYHCDKGNGRGFAAGAFTVERRVMYNFPLHQT